MSAELDLRVEDALEQPLSPEREENAITPSAEGEQRSAPLASASNGTADIEHREPPIEDILPAIHRLRAEQKKLREERARIARELKNAEKRRSRLKKRAKQLSDTDLMTVLQMRAVERNSSERDSGTSPAASSSQQGLVADIVPKSKSTVQRGSARGSDGQSPAKRLSPGKKGNNV